jgi:serine-type D-Ala-D-Ala carboxypeptidase/endopeptidase (penicillin-binding protein 4)
VAVTLHLDLFLLKVLSLLNNLMEQWTGSVKSAGIKKVNGNIISDDFLFDRNPLPDYYPWIDMGNYYGAGTSALTIHDNLYYLYFNPEENR